MNDSFDEFDPKQIFTVVSLRNLTPSKVSTRFEFNELTSRLPFCQSSLEAAVTLLRLEFLTKNFSQKLTTKLIGLSSAKRINQIESDVKQEYHYKL